MWIVAAQQVVLYTVVTRPALLSMPDMAIVAVMDHHFSYYVSAVFMTWNQIHKQMLLHQVELLSQHCHHSAL